MIIDYFSILITLYIGENGDSPSIYGIYYVATPLVLKVYFRHQRRVLYEEGGTLL